MNSGFSSRFDQMREGDPAKPTPEQDTPKLEGDENYPSSGNVRNLCLVWPNRKRMFLNYAYLVSGEYEADGETNTIKLTFTSHIVMIKGYKLDGLFVALMQQVPRILEVEDRRYLANTNPGVVIIEITINQ